MNPAGAFVVDPDTQHLYAAYGRGNISQMERQKLMAGTCEMRERGTFRFFHIAACALHHRGNPFARGEHYPRVSIGSDPGCRGRCCVTKKQFIRPLSVVAGAEERMLQRYHHQRQEQQPEISDESVRCCQVGNAQADKS